MNTEETKEILSIQDLRREISENESLVENYLVTAENMKWFAIIAGAFSIIFFINESVFSGIVGLVLCFLCVRKYNRSMGMAEIHNGITKFLKFMLHHEITGDTSLPGFLSK